MPLRDYQIDAVNRIYASLRTNKSVILQQPTGSGKTHVALAIIKHGLKHDRRIAFCVDRLTLLDQTLDKFWAEGIKVGVMQGNHPLYNPAAPVQLVSLQTLKKRKPDLWPDVDLWIMDEAHDQHQIMYDVMERWDLLKYIGLSATPFSTGLGLHWDDLVVATTTAELMEQGHLCEYVAYGPSAPDMKGIKHSKGDFASTDAQARMEPLHGDIISHYQAMADGKKALVFATNVAHARQLADDFKKAGYDADYVCGRDSEERREQVMGDFSTGKLTILVNVEVLTKGYDQPDIEVGILARPTRSLSLHIQMLGRLLRPHESKGKALILDHAGNIERLGFPDDDLPSELCMKEEGVSSKDKPEKRERLPWTCQGCHHINPVEAFSCESCGHVSERKQKVETKEGVLQKLERKNMGKKQTVYSQLLCHAQGHGYSKGWVSHKYREIFGVWPKNMKPTLETPTPELNSWIRSRQIAWAKRAEK